MIFEICAVASVFIFALLAFFIIRTLCVLQRSLKDVSCISYDLTDKLRLLDSTFKTISTLGDIGEVKSKQLREDEFKEDKLKYHKCNHVSDYSDDLAEVVIAAIKIGTKYFRR